MNLSELYDNIVLRDLLQYVTPGFVFLLGPCLILESLARRFHLGISPFQFVHESGSVGLFLTLIISYTMGHLLTGISALSPLRRREKEQVVETLNKSEELKAQITDIIMREMSIPDKAKATELLADAEKANMIREIGRSLIHKRLPELHREFVGRHSIFSRLCQNMAIAITSLLVAVFLSLWISWEKLTNIIQEARWMVGLAASYLLLISVVAIYVLINRSSRLRATMIKHTFQLWYVDSLDPREKESSKSADKENRNSQTVRE